MNEGTSISNTHAGSRWVGFQKTYAKQVAKHFPIFCGVIGLLAVVGAVAAVGGGLGALGKGPISQACRVLPPSFRLPGCLVLTAGGVTGLTGTLLGIFPIAYGKGMKKFKKCAKENRDGDSEVGFFLAHKAFIKMGSGMTSSSRSKPTSGFLRYHVGARLGYGATGILVTIATLWDLMVGAAAGVVAVGTAGKHPGARYVAKSCIKDIPANFLGGIAFSLIGLYSPRLVQEALDAAKEEENKKK